MMTEHDRDRLLTLEYQRDVALRHNCPCVAAARQREINKILKANDYEKETD